MTCKILQLLDASLSTTKQTLLAYYPLQVADDTPTRHTALVVADACDARISASRCTQAHCRDPRTCCHTDVVAVRLSRATLEQRTHVVTGLLCKHARQLHPIGWLSTVQIATLMNAYKDDDGSQVPFEVLREWASHENPWTVADVNCPPHWLADIDGDAPSSSSSIAAAACYFDSDDNGIRKFVESKDPLIYQR